jgi:hypothetical protein
VNSGEIDNGIGAINPVADGSVQTPVITTTTTFTLTVHGDLGDANCNATVHITAPPAPVCTLTANPHSFTGSGAPVISWTTQNAVSFSIDNAIGSVTPVASGSVTAPTITTTTTYTGTATAANGDTVHCSDTVTVNPPNPNSPVCTLTATPTSFVGSGRPTLAWTTVNGVSFSIDQGIGDVTPLGLASGSILAPLISATTTYTGTVVGTNGEVQHCASTVVVTPPPPSPLCQSFVANPTAIAPGSSSTLSWTTLNANAVSIDNNIGDVSANGVAAGSVSVTPSVTTTYTLTVSGANGGPVTCPATVTVTNTPGPSCTLAANPNSLPIGGGTTELTWTTSNSDTFTIDNGVGAVTPVAAGTTTSPKITSNTTFTGTAVGPFGTTTCAAPVSVTTHHGGCTSNCGGGGGHTPKVTLESAPSAPLAFLYLSQLPYTGLDLGPVGTVVYWLGLILWSLALAYLLIFKMLPYVAGRTTEFGKNVRDALNENGEDDYVFAHAAPAHGPAHAHTAPARPAPRPVVADDELVHAHYSANVEPVVIDHTEAIVPETSRGYSTYDGFRSFGNGALSIDDIVKGLSREPVAPARTPAPAPVHEEHAVPAAPRMETPRPAPVAREAAPVATEVPHFINSILAGDREAVFGMIRDIVRMGGNAEDFLTQVTCALDDAYRARLEGTPVHAEVKRLTDSVATPVLERLVTSLASAVDSSYSVGITGAKLALTRALAVLGA